MDRDYLICPLCGFEFEALDTLCVHGCPLSSLCDMTRCPSCEYEFPRRPRPDTWLRRLLGRRPRAGAGRRSGLRTVADLATGERATVVSLTGRDRRRNSLAVFGLVPGSEIMLLERRGAYVLRVGETELALERDIAAGIVVAETAESET